MNNLSLSSPYPYPPPKRKCFLAIAIPSSTTSIEPTLQLKTLKVGFIARALAIHRVNEIIVYNDKPNLHNEAKIIADILEYLRTPPYLRRLVVPMKDTLKYVGILPPLHTPNHPQSLKIKHDEVREGLITHINGKNIIVEIGLRKKLKIKSKYKFKPGDRVLVKVSLKHNKIYGKIINENDIEHYFCYKVSFFNDLAEVLRKPWDLTIATSRYGVEANKVSTVIKEHMSRDEKILIAFGGPKEGLYEIAARAGLILEESFDIIVNTIPYQGVETVRTEEAIHATLEFISLLEA